MRANASAQFVPRQYSRRILSHRGRITYFNCDDLSIDNSNLYAVVTDDGQTVACARIVTDRATFGWVSDVFVDTGHRGRGLASWMVGEIVDHWTTVGLRRVLLATRDAHDLYAKVGFTPLAHPERMMEIDRRAAF